MTEKYEAANTYTDQELLDLAREAIARIVSTGQAYSTILGGGNRLLTRANLDELRTYAKELEATLDAATYGPAVNYARFARG